MDSLCSWKNQYGAKVGLLGLISREEVKAGVGGRKAILITMVSWERRVFLGSLLRNKIKSMYETAGFCIFHKGQSTQRTGGAFSLLVFFSSGSYCEIHCTSSIRPLSYSSILFTPPFSTVCQHLQSIQSINLMEGWPSGGLKGPNLGWSRVYWCSVF